MSRGTAFFRIVACPVLLAAVLVSTMAGCVLAQEAGDQGGATRSFTGMVGLGVIALPRYSGGDEMRVRPLPIFQIEYRKRVYLGGSQTGVGAGLGVFVIRNRVLSWDFGLAGTESRPERRGDALTGMGKRDAASFATTGMTFRVGRLLFTSGAALGVEREAGAYGSFGVGTDQPIGSRWWLSASTGATVADERNMAFDFGVTPAQATARRALAEAGDPRMKGVIPRAYAPAAGLKYVHASVALGFALTPNTRVLTFVQGQRLAANAAQSPIVLQRVVATAGAAYAYVF
jgi:outer membrane protein